MFCLFKKKPRKRMVKPKPQHPAAPTRRPRPTVGEVYAMVMDAKNALDSIPDIKEAYAVSEENGAQFVTDLAMRMAEEQYQNAQDLYRHLFYTQMDNLNDRPDNLGKTTFSMP